MDEIEWKRLARKRTRLEQQGKLNPFCCLCGEHHWAVRYELHHIAWRKYDPRTIPLCHTCHDKVSDMQKEFPPIPANTEPRLAKIIAMTRGRMTIARLMLQTDSELHDWLLGQPVLPDIPEAGSDNHD